MRFGMLANVNSKCNSTVEWFSVDSKSEFVSNSIKLGSNWEYIEKKISYKFNNQGYRTLDWVNIKWEDSVVVIGCSYTFGLGLAVEDTICNLLSSKFNSPFINLGVVGSSNQLMFYNSMKLLANGVMPKAVILLYSDPSRTTHFNSNDNTIIPIGNWIFPTSPVQQVLTLDKSKSLVNFYTDYIKDNNCDVHGTMAAVGVEALWKSKNVPVLAYSAYNRTMGSQFNLLPIAVDRSRDLSHPGSNSNKLWSDFIASDIVSQKIFKF